MRRRWILRSLNWSTDFISKAAAGFCSQDSHKAASVVGQFLCWAPHGSSHVLPIPQGKLPARITVPLSVISQPVKGKSVVTAPIIKGNLGANISGLGRNIILTTMPAGTKLIAGNKPVSFLTAQQLQQLQQQGQATQVRIQTVPASHLQQGTVSGSTKAVSTVVVTTAPSPKQTQDQLWTLVWTWITS